MAKSTPHFNDMIAARGGKGAGPKKAPAPKASPKIPAPPPMAPSGC